MKKLIDKQELFQLFTSRFGAGRPFGPRNKPVFGMSDGNEGVQWNLVIWTDIQKIQQVHQLGVNLEGMKYLRGCCRT
jgi:hypothetical protein